MIQRIKKTVEGKGSLPSTRVPQAPSSPSHAAAVHVTCFLHVRAESRCKWKCFTGLVLSSACSCASCRFALKCIVEFVPYWFTSSCLILLNSCIIFHCTNLIIICLVFYWGGAFRWFLIFWNHNVTTDHLVHTLLCPGKSDSLSYCCIMNKGL